MNAAAKLRNVNVDVSPFRFTLNHLKDRQNPVRYSGTLLVKKQRGFFENTDGSTVYATCFKMVRDRLDSFESYSRDTDSWQLFVGQSEGHLGLYNYTPSF